MNRKEFQALKGRQKGMCAVRIHDVDFCRLRPVSRWADEALGNSHATFLSPFQGLGFLCAVAPGRRSQTRFALGYLLSGFQPVGCLIGFHTFGEELAQFYLFIGPR